MVTMDKSFSIPISRRSFMKLAGLAAVGTLLGVGADDRKAEAAAPSTSSVDFSGADLPVLFNADVCVVGGGAAGTAAGIAAAWGLSHGVEANAIRWENIPKNERSYVSEGDTSQSYIK